MKTLHSVINERLTTINCTDLDKGIPIGEVLKWLDTVSQKGSITSTDERLLGKLDKNYATSPEEFDHFVIQVNPFMPPGSPRLECFICCCGTMQ